MKRIIAQKGQFFFMNGASLIIAMCSICGGVMYDSSWFYVLFVSLFFSSLSLFALVNRIYFNETCIEFRFITKKLTITFDDIKEIYVYKYWTGMQVVFNFEKELGYHCASIYEYNRECTKAGIKNRLGVAGMTRKDYKKIMQNYNGKIN